MSLTTSLVSGAKPRTPKGSSRTAQGASPGFKGQIAESPERAAQGVRSQLQINARHKARLFGTGTNCIAPSGLPLLLCLFPGLAPWAFLSRPCGASFAPETSLVSPADSYDIWRPTRRRMEFLMKRSDRPVMQAAEEKTPKQFANRGRIERGSSRNSPSAVQTPPEMMAWQCGLKLSGRPCDASGC